MRILRFFAIFMLMTACLFAQVNMGPIATPNLNGIRYANKFSGATPALQITAACADAGANGVIIAPFGMSAGDPATLANGCVLYDYRSGSLRIKAQDASTSSLTTYFGFGTNLVPPYNSLGAMIVFREIMPYVPASGRSSDLILESLNSFDVRLRPVPLQTTATTTVTGGAGAQTISVTSTAGFYCNISDTPASLIINQFQTDQEYISCGSWSVVDSTHLSITPLVTHTQPYKVSQYGAVVMHSPDFYWLMTDGTATGDYGTALWHIQQSKSGSTDKAFTWYLNGSRTFFRYNTDGAHVPEFFGDSTNGSHWFGSNGATGTCGDWNMYNNATDVGLLYNLACSGVLKAAQGFKVGSGATLATTNQTGTGNILMSSTLPLTGTTGSIGGGALTAGNCSSGTVSVMGASPGMPVVVSTSDGSDIGGSFRAYGLVTSSNTVTVFVCDIVAGTPAAKTYNVRVIQ